MHELPHRAQRLRACHAAADQPSGAEPGAHWTLAQYRLTDGQILERIVPAAGLRTALLRAGQKVLVWYDPGDVLVYGRWGRAADWAFMATGAVLVLTGLILA